jgi:hypothetical protein
VAIPMMRPRRGVCISGKVLVLRLLRAPACRRDFGRETKVKQVAVGALTVSHPGKLLVPGRGEACYVEELRAGTRREESRAGPWKGGRCGTR